MNTILTRPQSTPLPPGSDNGSSVNSSTGFDGGVLEIDINGAGWVDIVAAGGVFVSGGYNCTISTAYQSPIAGRPAWTGNSTNFVATQVTLPPGLAGATVQLRWRATSDVSFGYDGQWVDTIALPYCNIACSGGDPVYVPPVGNSLRLSGGGGRGDGGGAVVSWTDPPGPFNVYRGLIAGAWSFNHTRFELHNATGQSTDAEVPGIGQAFYYLVTRKHVDYCVSVPGFESSGAEEPNPYPCP